MGGFLRASYQDRHKGHLPSGSLCGKVHEDCRDVFDEHGYVITLECVRRLGRFMLYAPTGVDGALLD